MAKSAETDTVQNRGRYHFFWESSSIFSQWYPSQFTVEHIRYNCAEQYMMHQKAVLFGDTVAADRIMKTKDPKTQKALGRKVKYFQKDIWEQNCFDLVKRGNMAKFSQNADLKEEMLGTGAKILVEASPYDQIWGIGLREDNPLAWDENTWCGKNLLGYALTEVRDQLIKESKTS